MPVESERRPAGNAAPERSEIVPGGGRVEAVTRIGDGVLLALVSSAAIPARRAVRGWLVAGADRSQKLSGWRIELDSEVGSADAALLLLHPARRDERLRQSGQLVVEAGDQTVALEPPDIQRAAVDLEPFGSERLGGLEPRTQRSLLDEIAGLVGRLKEGVRWAAADLQALRDATRSALPHAEVVASAALTAQVDGIYRVDSGSVYVEGWVRDRTGTLERLRLLSPEGRQIEISDIAFRYPRPDVSELLTLPTREDLGFIAFVEMPEESVLSSGWILQAELADRTGVEVEMPPVSDDPRSLRLKILSDIDLDGHDDGLKTRHARPALTRLEARLVSGVEIDTVEQHGELPADPLVSIVIPLYRRTDYLEHQLAQFVHDADFAHADLIYMLDSPEDAKRLRPFAAHLHQLYGVPFRLACLTDNGGFSVVNNLGASLARGRFLVLLNSDILPAGQGWLSRMVAFYGANPKIGALGAKLLYEDESIQHAGLYFDRPAGAHVWSNEHYYKGMHRDFAAANVARRVPAVTGACLMIEADLYRELGGLQGDYVRGDYEDSDLCLRLQEKGRECWYLPDVELYHLEGQSYPTAERSAASRYNQWLQTEVWRKQLEDLTST